MEEPLRPTASLEESMIERVAKAIVSTASGMDCYDDIVARKDQYALARAAIEAMDPPTEPMIDAAFKAEADSGGMTFPGLHWVAMIRAALSSSPKGGS